MLRGEVGSEAFHGKIVLVGSTSPLLHDQFPAAFARRGDMPGVEIHANAIETLVRGNRIREIPGWVSTLGAVGLALLSSALVVRFHALRALIAVGVLWLVLALGAFAIFAVFDVWIRSMAGTLALVLGYGATVVVPDSRPTKREGGN